jgi:hypothetical protein
MSPFVRGIASRGFSLWFTVYLSLSLLVLQSGCATFASGPVSTDQESIATLCKREDLDASIKELHSRMLFEVKQYLARQETGMAQITGCREIAENRIRSNPCGIDTRVTFQCTITDRFVPRERQVKVDAAGSTDRNGPGFLTVVSYVSKTDETNPTLGEDRRERWRSQAAETARERQAQLADCRLAFASPAGWQTDIRERNDVCWIRLRPEDWTQEIQSSDIDLPDYPVEVEARHQSFLSAAEQAGFEWRQGKWLAHGRQGMETDVEAISGEGWGGLRAAPQIGSHYKKGGFAGLAETDRILIQAKDGRIALIEGLGRAHEASEKILSTFRFLLASGTPSR